MSIGLIVEKCGMSRLFPEDGSSVPITILKADTVSVTQVKNCQSDGYMAIQLSMGEKKPSRLNKPTLGHYKKANVKPGVTLVEFRIECEKELEKYPLGSVLKVEDVFQEGQIVDVTATSKGKGFAGAVKRHNFATQDATHGNSLSHRAPGSIGQNQTPGRVFKGKKMAGHMGNVRCTVQNQKIVKIDAEKGLIMVKGVVPGANGGTVIIRPAVKKTVGDK